MESATLFASQNQLKTWAKLSQAKYRREEGAFLAEGVKIIGELFRSRQQIEAVVTLPEKRNLWKEAAIAETVPIYQTSRADFKKLSQDKEPEGILAVVRTPEPPDLAAFLRHAEGHILVCHEISNPQNLGALLRTAWWFGFSGMILGKKSVDWTHPKVIRASMGAAFHLTIVADVDLLSAVFEIKKHYRLIGSDVREGDAPKQVENKTALILGSESHGLPEDLLNQADLRWRIPGANRAESLSLPQAAAILMYEMTKTREQG